MYCSNCGNKIVKTDKFCSNCGKKTDTIKVEVDIPNTIHIGVKTPSTKFLKKFIAHLPSLLFKELIVVLKIALVSFSIGAILSFMELTSPTLFPSIECRECYMGYQLGGETLSCFSYGCEKDTYWDKFGILLVLLGGGFLVVILFCRYIFLIIKWWKGFYKKHK